MPDTEEMARDLTVIYLQIHSDKDISEGELIKKYKETFEKFKNMLADPPCTATLKSRGLYF